jgi:hypothetical protein
MQDTAISFLSGAVDWATVLRPAADSSPCYRVRLPEVRECGFAAGRELARRSCSQSFSTGVSSGGKNVQLLQGTLDLIILRALPSDCVLRSSYVHRAIETYVSSLILAVTSIGMGQLRDAKQ